MEKLLEVPIPEELYEGLLARAKSESRSVGQVIADAFQNSKAKRRSLQAMGEAIRSLQEDAQRNGLSKTTLEEINHEIAEPRKEMAAAARTA